MTSAASADQPSWEASRIWFACDAPNLNVITIDGRAIEYRLERRDGTTALHWAVDRDDLEMIDVLKRLDVACALNTAHRRVEPTTDAYQWGRFYVGESDSGATLAAKLSGWYSALATPMKTLGRPLKLFKPSRQSDQHGKLTQQTAGSWAIASPLSEPSQ